VNYNGTRAARFDTKLTKGALVFVFFNSNRYVTAFHENIYRTHLDAPATIIYSRTLAGIDFYFNELSHLFCAFRCCFYDFTPAIFKMRRERSTTG
jgi:hypothetical protein